MPLAQPNKLSISMYTTSLRLNIYYYYRGGVGFYREKGAAGEVGIKRFESFKNNGFEGRVAPHNKQQRKGGSTTVTTTVYVFLLWKARGSYEDKIINERRRGGATRRHDSESID